MAILSQIPFAHGVCPAMPNPFVSIIIPSRRPDMLPDALESLHKQTDQDFEVLVAHKPLYVEGMDGLAEPVEKINRLASIAQGTYFLILPDDDILFSWSLAVWGGIARRYREPDVVYTPKWRLDAQLHARDIWPVGEWTKEEFCRRNPVEGLTALVHRDMWNAIGGMDPAQLYYDWAFWYECFKWGPDVVREDIPLWGNRMHGDQFDSNGPLHAEALRLLRAKYPELTP